MKHDLIVMLCLLLTLPVFAQEVPSSGNFTETCIEDFDPAMDYFPDKVEPEYAEGFAVEYHNHYKIVTVLQPWQNAEDTFQYVLVQCGTPAPEGFNDVPVVTIPVERFISMSTTVLPHLETQTVLDRLIGIDTALFITNEAVIELVGDGTVEEVGGGGSFDAANLELMIDLEPDLVMTQQFFAGDPAMASLIEAGLPVVLNADFADTSPLGQAEWGKFVSLFFNTEAAANDAFAEVATAYEDLQALTSDIAERPTVLAASPFDGTWYMPGSDSTVAELIADAGGDFLWADTPGTSIPLDFEVVFERAADADVWVNINQFWNSVPDLLAADERFAGFAAVENGALWNNNMRMNANGGNDYFESGAANPHLLLADLIAIFHPDLLPDHEFVYYQPLTSE